MARILLIDDEELVLSTLQTALTKAGHEVVTARNGSEGLAAFRRQPVDLVITDIIMPEKEGIETIIEMRRQTASLPIIAISGGGQAHKSMFLQAAGTLGATRTLAKPFSPSQLVNLVSECLGGKT